MGGFTPARREVFRARSSLAHKFALLQPLAARGVDADKLLGGELAHELHALARWRIEPRIELHLIHAFFIVWFGGRCA